MQSRQDGGWYRDEGNEKGRLTWASRYENASPPDLTGAGDEHRPLLPPASTDREHPDVHHRSIFGFHSRANFCASAIWSGVIVEAIIFLFFSASFLFSISDAGNRWTARLNHMVAST